ncbi:coniferyl alcohol acyltransferase-like [Bidens hawaiensis]|uniref:coniferyl alcohol acyltransferase-like n=1 Tax=Bidens hawaiensis TaxID=980011 RepID=UPI00404B82F8
MGIGDDSFLVEVIENKVVQAEEPWVDQWLTFTNFDLLVPPFDIGSIFFYKNPSHDQNFPTIVNTLKASLSRALALYPPLAGEIEWNEAAGENQIHCNNRGVQFIEAVAEVDLKELNLYKPDECIEGKLMPKKLQHGVLGIQVTKLKCDGLVIGVMVDHRVVDGYSANMFISTWADMTRSKTPSMIPSFGRSHLKPRSPTSYSPLIDNVFATFLPPPSHPDNDLTREDDEYRLVNRVYYIEGEALNKLQLLANEGGYRRSKLVAFTSFLWKSVSLSMENSGKQNGLCNVIIAVDGRRRLSEDEDEEKQKLMASHFGNVLSMPYGSKTPQELKEMSLSDIATEVQEFLKPATTKEHFLDIIDWVEDQKPQPLISKALLGEEITSFTVSAGQRFETMDAIDFGWGKVTFGSCHVPSSRKDCFLMTMGSPKNNEDWVVYMHLPLKHTIFIEEHASQVFKPLDADYIQI